MVQTGRHRRRGTGERMHDSCTSSNSPRQAFTPAEQTKSSSSSIEKHAQKAAVLATPTQHCSSSRGAITAVRQLDAAAAHTHVPLQLCKRLIA